MMQEHDATAVMLRHLVPACTLCHKPVSPSHDYLSLATAVAEEGTVPELKRLFDAVKAHDWATVHQFNGWEAEKNSLEVYAIKCSEAGGFVAVIRDPYDLWEPKQLYQLEPVSGEELAAISDLGKDQSWRPL